MALVGGLDSSVLSMHLPPLTPSHGQRERRQFHPVSSSLKGRGATMMGDISMGDTLGNSSVIDHYGSLLSVVPSSLFYI